MNRHFSDIVLTLISLLLCIVQAVISEDTYRAAVIDYACAKRTNEQTAEAYVLNNAKKMVGVIEKAKAYNADIVVFPELGTMSYETYFVAVPDPKDEILPADHSSSNKVLSVISRAARLHKIYVVINVLENCTTPDGQTLLYNTNVAFDRNGIVVARYRKYNLYGEYNLNRTNTPESVYFDTDFGVRFGMFICFDIHFEHPAMDLVRNYNVTHFVYSASWWSELPFMTSIQVQNAFSYGNDVIVLASGLNDIINSHTGSGIYRGRYGQALTWQSHKDGTTLIVGNVPKSVGHSIDYTHDLIDDSDTHFQAYLDLWQEKMSDYSTKLISPAFNKATRSDLIEFENVLMVVNKTFEIGDQLCRGNLCCTYNITMVNTYLPPATMPQFSAASDFRLNGYLHYRMAIANGLRSYSAPGLTGQQVCGVISCLSDDDVTSCARQMKSPVTHPVILDPELGVLYLNSTIFSSIKITGNFSNKNALHTISTLSASRDKYQVGKLISDSNVEFKTRSNAHLDLMTVSLNFSDNQLVSGAIFVRTYDKDSTSNGSAAWRSSASFMMYCFGVEVAVVLGWLEFHNIM